MAHEDKYEILLIFLFVVLGVTTMYLRTCQYKGKSIRLI